VPSIAQGDSVSHFTLGIPRNEVFVEGKLSKLHGSEKSAWYLPRDNTGIESENTCFEQKILRK